MRTSTTDPPGHLAVNADEAPPPPYSETDIYSNSGGLRTPIINTSAPSCVGSNDEGASRQSPSSAGEAIFTPPETPRIVSNSTVPSSQLYFESRPPPPSLTLEPVVHSLDLKAASSPDDFPYQAQWAPRDVTPQDWATFINYLLPDHTTRGNEAIMGRKILAESQVDDATGSGGRSQAEAQFDRLRGSSPDTVQERADSEATVQQWNNGFFGPRGLHIQLVQRRTSNQMPGAWNPAFDAHPAPPWPGGPQQQPSQSQIPRSRTWGSLTIADDGIRYGNKFSADRQGLRVGSLVMDSNGIRIGNEPLGVGPRPPVWPGPPQPPPWAPQILLDDPICEPQHHRTRRQYEHVGGQREAPPAASGERGRRNKQSAAHERSPSVDSLSSASSSTSSASESSVGSLPNYENVREQQLPLYVARLETWLSSPDQLRSKKEVKQLKTELKEGKTAPDPPPIDVKALRARLKSLSQEWKVLKKQQKVLRKSARRERRQRRKAERKERRQNRKEVRRARRDYHKGKQSHAVPSSPKPPSPPRPPSAPRPPHGPFAPGMNPFSGPPPAYGPPHVGFGPQAGPSGRPFGPPAGLFGPPGPLGPPGPFGPPGGGPGFMGRGRGPLGSVFGGHAGRRRSDGGYGRAPSSGPSRQAPGAWPEDSKHPHSHHHHHDAHAPATPPPGAASAAKYRAAEKIVDEIRAKARQAMDMEAGKGRQVLDDEIEALAERLKEVRMEADEEYARELATHEG